MPALINVYTVIKHRVLKQLGQEKVNFIFQFSGHTPSPKEVGVGTRRKNREAKTAAGAVEKCWLLTRSPGFLSLLFDTAHDCLPRVALPTVS